jgi:CubicO group peptidase (beta-lactamase class C family)
MHIQEIVSPEEVGLSSAGLNRAADLLSATVRSGFVPGLATAVYRAGKLVRVCFDGSRNPADPDSPVERNTIFLVASVTKPIVCAGALLLLQEGAFHLDQPLCAFIPEFRGGGKENILLRHLFTHTSGLCDQLPESPQFRGRHAPLKDFVKAVCESALLFPPGTGVSYQSMGILMLGELVERLTGMRLRDYLRERLFGPLEMQDSTLGLPPSGMTRAAYSLPAPFPPGGPDVGDDWNTPYWRDTGAPWGGLHSTVEDLGRFLMHMLGCRKGPLSLSLRAAMTRDQLASMPLLSAEDKLTNHWGLGWRLAASHCGDLVSADTFSHAGATGAMYWADPRSGLACVLLTNQPRVLRDAPREHDDLLPRYSNALAAGILTPGSEPREL